MCSIRAVATVVAATLMSAGCAQAPVEPIPEAARRSVTSISGDVSGLKHADTSKLGARGSAEGAQLGGPPGASMLPGGASGVKRAGTSKRGARGSSEGAQLGAQQAASILPGGGGILGLAVMGVG